MGDLINEADRQITQYPEKGYEEEAGSEGFSRHCMNNDVLVTVQCLAYNHEKYIRDALDGFVSQKTDFRFEVIIHDDASTDKTADIIREYAEKYDFIKPIFQTENQYRKGVWIAKEFIYPIAQGKYMAYCEGDDYWTDEYKLQKQVDFMEAHPEYSSVSSSYNVITEDGKSIIRVVRTLKNEGTVDPGVAIEYNNPPQLASQMFRMDVVKELPLSFRGCGVGDYALLLYSITRGKLYYQDFIAANKREASNGSWTQRVYNDPKKRVQHFENMVRFLNMYDTYTSGVYKASIDKRLEKIQFNCFVSSGDYSSARKNPFYKQVTLKRKLQINIGCVFPRVAMWIEKRLQAR